jgi:hypothetical protein
MPQLKVTSLRLLSCQGALDVATLILTPIREDELWMFGFQIKNPCCRRDGALHEASRQLWPSHTLPFSALTLYTSSLT